MPRSTLSWGIPGTVYIIDVGQALSWPLGIPIRKVVIAVDAGRNLAVLVEAAVRNTVLQLRGIHTYKEFIERHQRAMERGDLG